MEVQKPDLILERLQAKGYEAYYVGGCVRDLLLGRPVHDWDITTSALPEQTMACFAKCVPTGIRHGTVTVLEGDFQVEVTTFRTEGSYADGRHPDQVRFVRCLSEDLARRDFTINAMAMDAQGSITDLYGGRKDLKQKLIRCVGDPDRRFREDALRMPRALRFSAQLGFSVEQETYDSICRCAHLCRKLSSERIRDEVEKTLLSDHPEQLGIMAELGLLSGFVSNTAEECTCLAELPRVRRIRWAGLCRIWPDLDLTALRLDKQTIRIATSAARLELPQTRLGWKRVVAQEGESVAETAAALANASGMLWEILCSGECLSLRQLAVNGSDFPEYRGRELGALLQRLLIHVLEHPEDNDRKKLQEISKISIDYHY